MLSTPSKELKTTTVFKTYMAYVKYSYVPTVFLLKIEMANHNNLCS